MSVTISASSQAFNRGFLDRKDPSEGIGEMIFPFSFSQIYDDIEEKEAKLPQICEQLYARVIEKLQSGSLGQDISFKVVEYEDAKQRNKEGTRKYIVITRETNRKTRITVLARFLPYGDKLYVSVDSHVLGSLDLWNLAWRVAVTLLPLICTLLAFVGNSISSNLSAFGSGPSAGEIIGALIGNVVFCLIPWILLTGPFFWLSVLRNFQQEQDIFLALRQSYNRVFNVQSYNLDDILMTLKSVLPLTLYSIRDVLEENDIPVKTLDAFVESIQTVNNIQNIYGSYNAVAGAGGTASVRTSQSS